MSDFMKDGKFDSESYQRHRSDLLVELKDLFISPLPEFLLDNKKRKREWIKGQVEIAENVWSKFSDIDFDSDPMILDPMMGNSIKDINEAMYQLSIRVKKDARFDGNGMEFTIRHKDHD